MSQAELGEIFSVSEANISFFESNKRPPTYKLLNKIAKYLGATPWYLLGDIDKTVFGSLLKELREKYFLTQHDLRGIINIPQNTISNHEKGKNYPSVETLYLIADYYDISIDYLVGRTCRKELTFIEDKRLQEVGKEYFEVDIELKKLGLTPQRVLKIINTLDNVGLINEK